MSPFGWFLLFAGALVGTIAWLTRGAISELSKQAGVHAQLYAKAYAKGSALITIAALTSFDETFAKLGPDEAAVLPWWMWMRLFFKPVISALAVFAAFMDGTVQEIKQTRDIESPKK